MKKSLSKSRRHTLISVIGTDLFRHEKLHLCLFTCIIVTAFLVVTSVHYTRVLRIQREQLFLEYDLLDAEWRSLILEENVLNDYKRVALINKKASQVQHTSSQSSENNSIRK